VSTSEAAVAALAVLVVAVVAFSARNWRRQRTRVDGPFGTRIELAGDTDAGPAVTMRGIVSRGGNVIAKDGTGRGTAMSDVDAMGDVVAVSDAGESRDS
jgi:hypothetical protein